MLHVSSQVRQTPEEGWRTYRPKRWGNHKMKTIVWKLLMIKIIKLHLKIQTTNSITQWALLTFIWVRKKIFRYGSEIFKTFKYIPDFISLLRRQSWFFTIFHFFFFFVLSISYTMYHSSDFSMKFNISMCWFLQFYFGSVGWGCTKHCREERLPRRMSRVWH